MSGISILDCTLRDGGYCNDCYFGFENQKKIIQGLLDAKIDIIECGFLMNSVIYEPDATRFTSLEQIAKIIPTNRDGRTFVALTDYGKYNPYDIPEYDGSSVDGLRVAFYKRNCTKALQECRIIKEKGYKVFVQPMLSLSYADKEFIDLIGQINEIEPYAFYIVDSFGMMTRKDLTRFFYLVEHNLKKSIRIGFHSHNNMQMAYSNAQSLVDLRNNRDLIIDSSIFGMGRGAGNLNTELFIEYLNKSIGSNYNLRPLLTIMDEILNEFYQRNPWGYSLSNYLSAAHNVHPNYAGYLDDKKTLTIEAMDEIFKMMDPDRRLSFDRKYIEELYLKYMSRGGTQDEHKVELEDKLVGKKVLLIAPGKSSADEKEKILAFAERDDVISICVNCNYPKTDYIFLSNLRRFRELDTDKRAKCIVTSNIPAENVYLKTRYQDLLIHEDAVRDNAGLMAIKFLIACGVKELYLAGFDGYSYNAKDNYADSKISFTKGKLIKAMNAGMSKMLAEFQEKIEIQFVTTARHIILKRKT